MASQESGTSGALQPGLQYSVPNNDVDETLDPNYVPMRQPSQLLQEDSEADAADLITQSTCRWYLMTTCSIKNNVAIENRKKQQNVLLRLKLISFSLMHSITVALKIM